MTSSCTVNLFRLHSEYWHTHTLPQPTISNSLWTLRNIVYDIPNHHYSSEAGETLQTYGLNECPTWSIRYQSDYLCGQYHDPNASRLHQWVCLESKHFWKRDHPCLNQTLFLDSSAIPPTPCSVCTDRLSVHLALWMRKTLNAVAVIYQRRHRFTAMFVITLRSLSVSIVNSERFDPGNDNTSSLTTPT